MGVRYIRGQPESTNIRGDVMFKTCMFIPPGCEDISSGLPFRLGAPLDSNRNVKIAKKHQN